MATEDNMTPNTDGERPTENTPAVNRRHILMGGALLGVSGMAFARNPQQRYKDLSNEQYEALFPGKFGDWTTHPVSELVLPPESELADKLYQHILTRTYVNSKGEGVMFLAAYNSMQMDNVQVHRPEVCYYVGGFSIERTEPVDVALKVGDRDVSIAARSVTAVMGSRHENILYWTRIGPDFPQSWMLQRLAMTKANIQGYLADGLLFRVSVIDTDEEKAVRLMQSFVNDMLAHSGTATRAMIAGEA